MSTLRVLLLADTHLGLGPEHFTAFERALAPAFAGEVDLVVHGGDVFFRSRVKADLVVRAFEPLKRVANAGVPVFVVPGNHERSAIPFPILAMHRGIHIFDGPRTFALRVRGIDVAVAGFPNERNRIEEKFTGLVERTGWRTVAADVRLLCLHQTVEGATVGPADFVFRRNTDVIRGRGIPPGFAAVLSGHIHRHQVLRADLSGRPLAAPVFYPGAVRRTSSAERRETKGYLTIDVACDATSGGRVQSWTFHETSACEEPRSCSPDSPPQSFSPPRLSPQPTSTS